jgi:hypothetical protein
MGKPGFGECKDINVGGSDEILEDNWFIDIRSDACGGADVEVREVQILRRCRTGVEVDVATEQEEYAEEKVRETMRGIFLGWRSRRGSEMADKGEG